MKKETLAQAIVYNCKAIFYYMMSVVITVYG